MDRRRRSARSAGADRRVFFGGSHEALITRKADEAPQDLVQAADLLAFADSQGEQSTSLRDVALPDLVRSDTAGSEVVEFVILHRELKFREDKVDPIPTYLHLSANGSDALEYACQEHFEVSFLHIVEADFGHLQAVLPAK